VRFGIFDHMERRDQPLSELYEDRLNMVEAAETMGFWCYHKAEHHFTNLDVAPSSNVFFSAAAQRTEQIRFGSLVFLLPLYNPARLLEEICTLDQMTKGRLEVGVGKGINPLEHRLWGLDLEETKERFEEVFSILRSGFLGETLSHQGEHYSFDQTPLVLSPYQKGGPPIWYPGNVNYAGSHRLNTIIVGPNSALEGQAKKYRDLISSTVDDWNPTVETPTIGVMRHIYVAKTDEEAVERLNKAFPQYHRNLASLWNHYNTEPDPDPSVGGNLEVAMGAHIVVAGSPETVTKHIQEIVESNSIEYFVGAFAWGDLTHSESLASMELFAREIMPRFVP